MKPLKEIITSDQQTYIRKHVDFLCFDKRVDNHFNMGYYGSPQCGTPGCACGWMRVSLNDMFMRTEAFFGIHDSTDEWRWCFSTLWLKADNTAIGAAARLLYLLEYGLPENHRNILLGLKPYPEKITKWIDKVKQMKGKNKL